MFLQVSLAVSQSETVVWWWCVLAIFFPLFCCTFVCFLLFVCLFVCLCVLVG